MSRILDIRFFMFFPFSLSKFHGSIGQIYPYIPLIHIIFEFLFFGQMEKFTRKSHLSILYLKMSSMANKR